MGTQPPARLTEDDVVNNAPYWAESHSDPTDAFNAANTYASAIHLAFNPADGDGAQEGLLIEAVLKAYRFIESQRCHCHCCHGIDGDPCARCAALGRNRNQLEER